MSLKKAFFTSIAFIALLFVTGCWDSIELENRGLVISLGIDKFKPPDKEKQNKEKEKETGDDKKDESGEDKGSIGFDDGNPSDSRFTVSMILPNLDSIVSSGGDSKKQTIKKSDDKTIAAAIRVVDSYSTQKLYFGQARVCIIGADLLEDAGLLREALDALERNKDINRKIILLSTEDRAEDILDAEIDGDPIIGMFIAGVYSNNANAVAGTFKLNLESFISSLRTDGNGIIPKIKIEKGEIKLGGAAVIKDFKLQGWLNDEELRGLLWLKGNAKGAELLANFEGSYLPLKVTENKTDIKLFEEDNKIKCRLNIHSEGSLEEFKIDNELTIFEEDTLHKLEDQYRQVICDEIIRTHNILQNDFKMDAFGFKEHLRKFNYDLYLKYKDDWDNAYRQMEIIPYIDVVIKNVGSIK